MRILFACEHCDVDQETGADIPPTMWLNISQHKGNTYIEWDLAEPEPLSGQSPPAGGRAAKEKGIQ